MTTTLYAATTNLGKLRDFAESARLEGVAILPLPGIQAMPTPVEDAPNFAGNADLKAIAYSLLAPGRLVLADDSGLEVDALGGAPGVFSARFADRLGFESGSDVHPQNDKDDRNNRCLLSVLAESNTATGGRAGRGGRFVCTLALAQDGQVWHRATGEVGGEILEAAQGKDGFGYDPLFFIPRLGKTLAELSRAEKWAVSHRGQALRSLLSQLREIGL